ncbi:MAG: sugar ABC transporter permease [Candidatus Thermoplasmatota archaeon]|nr:sugar ABC transporter permease [Candidatus Thermoplasmatota archaeon]
MRISKTIIFSIPALIFGGILIYFLLWNLFYSFTNWSPINSNYKIVGFATYAGIFASQHFQSTLTRTLMWTGGMFLAGNGMGIVFASLIFFLKNPRLRTIYSSLFLYPLAIAMSAVAIIWSWIYSPSEGIDTLLKYAGLPTFGFISNSAQALPSLILITIWVYSGLASVFYLAAFQNVSSDSIESARMDSAGPIVILRKILLPEAKNAFIVSSALLIIFSLRIFTIPYVSTGINPKTETSVLYLFNFFTYGYYAQAAAVSIIVIVIAIIVVIPYALFGIKRWINA